MVTTFTRKGKGGKTMRFKRLANGRVKLVSKAEFSRLRGGSSKSTGRPPSSATRSRRTAGQKRRNSPAQKTKTRSKTMARTQRLSITKMIALGLPIAAAGADALSENNLRAGTTRFASEMTAAYTGINFHDGFKFEPKDLARGLGPLAMAKIVSRAKQSLGNPTIPFLPVTL